MTLPNSYQITSLDEITPPLFFGKIYAFPCDESRREVTLQVLQQGYTKLLRSWPYLGGDIVRDHFSALRPGQVTLVLPETAPDTEIPVVDLSDPSSGWTHSYAEVLEAGLPPSWLNAALFAPYAAGVLTTTKPFKVQVNWIPGGCLLTTCFSHAVVDGTGIANVVQCWARLCREIQGVSEVNGAIVRKISAVKPYSSISVPAAGHVPAPDKSFDALKTRPELWKLLGLDSEENLTPRPGGPSTPTLIPTSSPSVKGMRTVVYSFSRLASARLKADATPLQEDRWISTNDALTALIWRSVMRARFPNAAKSPMNAGDSKAVVYVGVDCRSLFKPELPPSHINNVILNCITELPLSRVVGAGSETLAALASTIRHELNTIKSDSTLVSDAAALASLLPDVGRLASTFTPFQGNQLATSSWVGFPFYDVDFGPALGRPDLIRVPRGQWTAVTDMFCLLGPRKPNGDVEVYISLKGDEMERFLEDTEFQKYGSFVCE